MVIVDIMKTKEDWISGCKGNVTTILPANPLWKGGKWEVMISELGETSMVVRITLGAPNPDIAFQLKSYVQEHIVDYLNQFKNGSFIGAVADQKPPMAAPEQIKNPNLEPAASACGAA